MGSSLRLAFFFGLHFYARLVGTTVLVRAPSPILVTMGKEPLQLECSYRTTGSETVMSLNWYHKATNGDKFKPIAQVANKIFDLHPTFTDRGLASRGKISTASAELFNTVRLEIDPVACSDGGEYECDVQVFGDITPHKAKVQVNLNDIFYSEESTAPVLSYDPASLIEDHPVAFTCTASMGRPVGTFRWLVYKSRHRGPVEEVELPGSTRLSKPAGRCSPMGTSTLAIVVTRADRKVKCVVEQQAKNGTVNVSDETDLDVKYRVSDMRIYMIAGKSDLPSSSVVVVKEGEDVHFMCRARGNPKSKFSWSYLPLNGQTGLTYILTHPELTMKNIRVNQSGSYVCVASSYIFGKEYSETRSVRVIVKDKVAFKLSKFKDENSVDDRYLLIGGVVTGALLLTVLITVLTVMCVRRCLKKSQSSLPPTQVLKVDAAHIYAEVEAFDVGIGQS